MADDIPTEPGRQGVIDPAIRRQVTIAAHKLAIGFLRQIFLSRPPVSQPIAVLAVALASAGLAQAIGNPAVIDVIAEEARRALREDTVTPLDIFRAVRADHP